MGYLDEVLAVLDKVIARGLLVREGEILRVKITGIKGVSAKEAFDIIVDLSKRFPVQFPLVISSSFGTVVEREGIELCNHNISSLRSITSQIIMEQNKSRDGDNNQVIKNKVIKTPLEVGHEDNIHIRGKAGIFCIKGPNRTYYFLRGCIDEVNDDLTIDIGTLFDYLRRYNDKYQIRFKIKNSKDPLIKWNLIRKTYNNIIADKIPIDDYIRLDKSSKSQLYWVKK